MSCPPCMSTDALTVICWGRRRSKERTLNANWNYLYFHVSPSSHSIMSVRSCRPFVNLLTPSAGLDECRNSFSHPVWAIVRWSSNHWHWVSCPGRATEGISTLDYTCRRCQKIDERRTGTNTTKWMGRRWCLKIKVIPILIPWPIGTIRHTSGHHWVTGIEKRGLHVAMWRRGSCSCMYRVKT